MENVDLNRRGSTAYFPLGDDVEYSRRCHAGGGSGRRNRQWMRRFLWRVVRDSKSVRLFCGRISKASHKQISFKYDAVSYSQNFDEGCHVCEEPNRRRSLVYPNPVVTN